MPVNLPEAGAGAVARMVYSFADHEMTLITPAGERTTMEVEPPGGTAQPGGRRIVYLDQGHWSTLARRIYEPDSIAQQDGIAAVKLIGWAREQRIVMPLSSGHVIELSRRWYMGDPVRVRYEEIAHVLSSESANTLGRDRLEIFTLDPDSRYAATTTTALPPAGLREYLDWLFVRLTATTRERSGSTYQAAA